MSPAWPIFHLGHPRLGGEHDEDDDDREQDAYVEYEQAHRWSTSE